MAQMKMKKLAVALVAFACVAVLSMPVMAFAALQTNYGWYKGHEDDSTYTISTAGEMKALANLVNGTADYDGDGAVDAAVSFAGKTIVLSSGGPVNYLGEAIEPIGTPEHPFQGTFDGRARQIDNFKLTVSASDASMPVSNVGLFGYVGSQGRLVGVQIGSQASISITRGASSTDYIANVGMVAGYCGGTMAGCENKGSLSIASSVLQKSADDFVPVRNVGGVVGQCVYDVTGCSNAGSVSVVQDSSPVGDFAHPQLVARVGGVAGLLGDEAKIGTSAAPVYAVSSAHGSISSCSNTGTVYVDTPKLSGLDRFGSQAEAESFAVGGVVGYSQGSVVKCTNGAAQGEVLGDSVRDIGYVNARNGQMVGGVCGSLRGVLATNSDPAHADDGADGADPLVLSGCENYGDVYGRATVGGIAGKASSYTTVTECLNSVKRTATGSTVDTYVVATRWNKPAPGGIVGTANGEVSYCANFATVASATWNDESARTLVTQDGYYAAGIVGMLTYFDEDDAEKGGKATPMSEVFSCYNAGPIIAGSNMRQRGIVGQNDGFTHDNVLVSGLVYQDEVVYGADSSDTEASGTVGENRVYGASELRGGKAAEAVAFLNSNSQANGWDRYWILPADSAATGLNAGYPLLDSQNPWGADATLITDAQVTLSKDASYTGGASVPEVTVKLGGATLTANADYRVVPQEGAVEPSTGRPYKAQVVGLGRYAGTATQTASYDIVAGDIGACTVTVAPHTFDYEAHTPLAADVTVRTPAGTTVPSDKYSFKVVDADGNEIAPTDADMYRVVVTPVDASLFNGTLEGTWRIKPASFMVDVGFDDAKVSYLDEDYAWVHSTVSGESSSPSTTLPYTGVAVKPAVSGVTYKGHTLVEGQDYRLIYGNSAADDSSTGDFDAKNMGKAGGSTIGCVTVRYISGQKTNFSSYANMFFNITDTGEKTDLSHATYKVEGDQISDGQPIRPVELYLGGTKLSEGVDYTIEYADNVQPGTATFTATGIGTFTGTLSGSFTIQEGSVYEILYSFSSGAPYEATVTGVEYYSSRATFDLVIPETVEHGGRTYTVVAIGDKALGGAVAGDFSGSVANTSKMKVTSVTVPQTVRSIGAYAFGSGSITMATQPALSSVVFAGDPQLESIGDYAFAQCTSLKSITVPAGVSSIGNSAFAQCRGLDEVRFLTERADMPSSVYERTGANGAFYMCDGVTIRGHAGASAVKAIAEGNAGTSSSGVHGGFRFSFEAFEAFDVTVSGVADAVFTGGAIRPAVVVKLGGAQLSEGSDYEVEYDDNVHVGTATVTVRGIGRFDDSVQKTFAIKAADIADADFPKLDDVVFSGAAVDLSPVLKFGGETLAAGTDYELSYADAEGASIAPPAAVGSYRLVVTGRNDFTGTRYRPFRIVSASIDDAQVAAVGDRYYTGVPIEPDADVSLGGRPLVRNRDYTVAYADNVAVGQATLTVRGMGGLVGDKSVGFRIVQAQLSDASIAGVSDVQATGSPVDFHPTVVKNGIVLEEGSDYTVSYAKKAAMGGQSLVPMTLSATDAGVVLGVSAARETIPAPSEVGDYVLVVTGMGNYAGTCECGFSILASAPGAKISLSGASLSVAGPQSYNGGYVTPSVTVDLGGTLLAEGVDYIVSYSGNDRVGTAVATVHGIGAYTGSCSTQFEIGRAAIGDADILPIADVAFDGAAAAPDVVVVVAGRSLVRDKDYTVAYENSTAAGTAKAIVTGIGNYAGKATAEFTVTRADMGDVTVSPIADATYAGVAQTPSVTANFGSYALKQGTDFTVEYSNNVNVGTATVTLTGQGSFAGTKTASFKVNPASIAGATVTASPASYVYDGSAKQPSVTVKLGSRTLAAGTDYTVSYSNNKNVGTATATVTGRGNYTGSARATFAITQTDAQKTHTVAYRTHVQNVGWQDYVRDGAMSGTSGRSLRLEGINVRLEDQPYSGGIEYRTHIQNIGWESTWKANGTMSGTSGQSLRLEAIQIRLTGEMASHYDVYYRVHCQNIGWMGWAKNGAQAGSAGFGYRLEGIQVKLVEKGGAVPDGGTTSGAFRDASGDLSGVPDAESRVLYRTHVQNVGWQNFMRDGEMAGTSGRSLRLEGIELKLGARPYAGGIEYRTHIQNIGWEGKWKADGEMSGTSGRALRLEAIQIRLTGEMASRYDVYYRVHAQNVGWMGWAKNGERAGTAGYAYRLEGINVVLVPKGDPAPGPTSNAFMKR